jgi:hypothetical protein
MTATRKLRTFADLVDLADSGEGEGRVLLGNAGRGQVWSQVEVEVNPDLPLEGVNQPGTMVFCSKSSTWTYEVERLRTDPRLREAIKRTAAMRRRR